MRTKIIAEVAQGFEGSFNQSKLLIKAAAKAKANAVKFQLVFADELATKDYKYYKLFKNLEMTNHKWKLISDYTKKLSIELMVDIFGKKSLSLADKLGIKCIKIHGTDITNIQLLRLVSKSNVQTVILGIGGSKYEEIEKATKILKNKKLIVLLGFQGYSTKTKDNQISRIKTLLNKIDEDVIFGFADHEIKENIKYTLPLIAIGFGAKIIEKHITLGKVMQLEDHESALNPDEFKSFVDIVRSSEKAIGMSKDKSDFGMSNSEVEYSKKIRRHVVSAKKILKGTIIKPEHLMLKRTSSKSSIQDLNKAYNKKIIRTIEKNQPINIKDLK